MAELPVDVGLLGIDLASWTDYAVAARYPGFGDPRADADLPALLGCAQALAIKVDGLVVEHRRS